MTPLSLFEASNQVSLMSKTPIRKLAPGQVGPRRLPLEYSSTSINLDEMLFSRFPRDQPGHLAQHFVLDDVWVMSGYGSDGVVIDSDGRLIAETAHFSQFRSDPDLLEGSCVIHDKPIKQLAIFFDCGWTTYYHFLIFGIGNFLRFKDDLPSQVPTLLPHMNDAYRKSDVGIQRSTVERILELTVFQRPFLNLSAGIHPVRELHLFWSNTPSSAGVLETDNFLAPFQDLALQVTGVKLSQPRRRLFIHRSGTNPRMTSAESALASTLMKDLGFEILILETLSFDQQVEAFASAEVVVAPHGAGLANLVFCDPSCLIVELNRLLGNQTHLRPWFYQLATLRGMNYAGFNLDKGEIALRDAFAFIESRL